MIPLLRATFRLFLMMKCFAVTVFFVLAAASASAGCISHNAGSGGLVLTHRNPYISTSYEQTSKGLIETRITRDAQGSKTVVAVYSHPLLVEKRTSGNEVLGLTYARDHADLDALPKKRYWSSAVDLFVSGKKQSHGNEELTYVGSEVVSFGACQYEVWKIDDRLYLEGRAPIYFTKYYSPTLRVVLRAVLKSPDGHVVMNTTYDELAALKR
jgi:hypothetical protein